MTYEETFDAALEHLVPQAHRMGVRAVEVAPGRVVCRVPLEGNGNHLGTIYAGVLFTVAEVLGGALCMPSFDLARFYPVVKSLRIDFRKPARSDVLAETSLPEDRIAEIAKTAEEHGKAEFTLHATLTDADGIVVAATEGVYQLRAHKGTGA
ncbi:PaaI family thioesterase [Actinokineospora soli]|uniref:PaaI family thioesterase n=1 Tax=Actinokineospora soli TaxID=1048753 RepID=A0ABW2TL91_9PSEU